MHHYKMQYSSMSPLTVIYLILLSVICTSALQIPLIPNFEHSHSTSSSPLVSLSEEDQLSSIISHLPKPSQPLQWGTLNILSLTDTHGWLRGHTHLQNIPESSYSASIANIHSFKAHLQEKANELGVDLLLVDSGDTVDGNGFVDADTSGVKGKMARRVLSTVGIDIATAGNHELYNYTVAHDVYENYIPTFKGHYLSSNINITLPNHNLDQNNNQEDSVPFGNRYLRFRTPNQNLSITAFGILFGFDRADKGLKVQSVFEMIQEGWWRDVMVESHDTDVFIILGHMATRDKDWLLVLNAIRVHYPTKPVLIFSGHAHVRDCIRPDPYSQVLASGRYMETLGFTSLTLPSSSSSTKPSLTSLTSQQEAQVHHNPLNITRRYLDNNLSSYLYHANKSSISQFQTETGKILQNEIDNYAKSFNLSYTFGYAPQSYYLDRYPITHQKSLVKLYVDEVFNTVVADRKRKHSSSSSPLDIPSALARNNEEVNKKHKNEPVFLFNTGGARFNIFKGNFTRDDQFTVIPFDNEVWSISVGLDYELVIDLVEWLNSLWGEPESIENVIIDNDVVGRKYVASDPEVARTDGRVEGNELKWDRKNEPILRDSFANSARRREAASEYATYLAEESINNAQSLQNSYDDADDENTEATNDEVPNMKNKKKQPKLTFGYVTKDKCGPYRGEGDDTKHRPIPAYSIPEFVLSTRRNNEEKQDDGHAAASDERVHLVFYEFIAPLVLSGLNKLQSQTEFTYSNLTKYSDLKANELLGEYAKIAWN